MLNTLQIEVLPTQERINKSLGLTGNKKSIMFKRPIAHLYERGVLGEHNSEEAKRRFNAAIHFELLYVVAEEGLSSARQPWDQIINGSSKCTAAEASERAIIWVAQRKKEYNTAKQVFLSTTTGRRSWALLKELCVDGLLLKEIEEKRGLRNGTVKLFITDALDDLIEILHL